jgi:hypothetical protein
MGSYDRAVVRKVRVALKAGQRVGIFASTDGMSDVYTLGQTDRLIGCVAAPLARSLRVLILERS